MNRTTLIHILTQALLFISLFCLGCEPPPGIDIIPTDLDPAWSPDGSKIVYYHFEPDDDNESYPTGLYLIDTTGQNTDLLLKGEYRNPDWSPDGSKIVLTRGSIYILNLTDGNLSTFTQFTTSTNSPAWSPDGEMIAFEFLPFGETGGIWIAALEDTSLKQLGPGRNPAWSPDNSMLVYEEYGSSTQTITQIWKMDTTGNNRIQLTQSNIFSSKYPTWSPDGKHIAWSTYSKTTSSSKIWLMNEDGSNQRAFTSGRSSPSWSPDSKRIVFSNFTENNDNILLWIRNIDGTNLRQLTFNR